MSRKEHACNLCQLYLIDANKLSPLGVMMQSVEAELAPINAGISWGSSLKVAILKVID